MDVLKVELQKVENEVLQLSIKEQLRHAYEASDEDLKYVQEEFSNFCKNQQLKKHYYSLWICSKLEIMIPLSL